VTLQAGTHLGSYEILAAIGAGVMGEVGRVRDTRLNRDVAINVLPGSFAPEVGLCRTRPPWAVCEYVRKKSSRAHASDHV
jgi:serine/threonine protein kinase